jgi:hypothetical protein
VGSAAPDGDTWQQWNLLMEWMKFIVLDTPREGRLKLIQQNHIGLKDVLIF